MKIFFTLWCEKSLGVRRTLGTYGVYAYGFFIKKAKPISAGAEVLNWGCEKGLLGCDFLCQTVARFILPTQLKIYV